MKKNVFIAIVSVLVIILIVVSFYMLNVHIPYYDYHNHLDHIRNNICEKENYEYKDYFFEYRGHDVLYVMKINVNDQDAYVVYDEDEEYVDSYQGKIADEKAVIKDIKKRYKVNVEHLDIAYDHSQFIYYAKYQDEDELIYFYYDLQTGEFIRAVQLGD